MDNSERILRLVQESNRIVITSHRNPDGDSVGSSLGLARFLKSIGKSPVICHPDATPNFIKWLVDDGEIEIFDENEEAVKELMISADLIFCLDYNGSSRMGKEMGDLLDSCSGNKIMIDHHPNPSLDCDISVSKPEVGSTSQLILEWIRDIGKIDMVNPKMGAPMYLGMVTDTGSFRFSSVSGDTHELVAYLLKNGLKHTEIHERTFDNNRLDQLKLRGFAIAEKTEIVKGGLAIISLTQEELKRFNYIKGDTEGLVNVGLSIEGVRASVLVLEKDDAVKLSFRSLGDLAINGLAREHFDGGGHLNAAGGISFVSIEETIDKIKAIAPAYL